MVHIKDASVWSPSTQYGIIATDTVLSDMSMMPTATIEEYVPTTGERTIETVYHYDGITVHGEWSIVDGSYRVDMLLGRSGLLT